MAEPRAIVTDPPAVPIEARIPKVRHALHLLIPEPGPGKAGGGMISVTETLRGGRVAIETSGLPREVMLTAAELYTLSRFCSRISARVRHRPKDQP